MNVSQLIRLFLDWCQMHRRPRTVEFYELQLTQWLAKVGDKLLADLVPLDLVMHCQAWHTWVAVQRLFNWAVKPAKVLAENPFLDVDKPKLGKRKLSLDAHALVSLRRKAATDMRALLLCVEETACRPQEVRVLDFDWLRVENDHGEFWSQVRAGLAFFVLDTYKSQDARGDDGPSRILPVSPRLGRLLYRLAQRGTGKGLIFRTGEGKAWTKNAIVCRMRRLRARLGWRGQRGQEKVCLYTLRHSAATLYAAAGVPGTSLQHLLGHRKLTTTQRYLHLERWAMMRPVRDVWQRRPRPSDGTGA